MKQRIISILIVLLILAVTYQRGLFKGLTDRGRQPESLAYAYEMRLSDIQVEGGGTVERVLEDDTEGIAHQRFILRVGPEQTILVAHNLDLAPRVENLNRGDSVRFSGEYEWNDKGGVVHWTHRDPDGRHRDGWIFHDGKRYE